MIQTFTFARSSVAPGALYLTRPAQAILGRGCPGRTVLAHGTRRLEAAVVPAGGEDTALPVAAATADALGLAEGIPYRLRWRGELLLLGPVIGIHVERPELASLAPGRLAYNYLLRYPLVGGLVYLFSTEGIDYGTETIEGYGWVPGEPDAAATEGDSWEYVRRYAGRGRATAAAEAAPPPPHPRAARFEAMKQQFLAATPLPAPRGEWHGAAGLGAGRLVPGRYPFPAALWRRAVTLPETGRARFLKLGTRLFNSHFFDKLEGYRLLAAHPTLRHHLPETEPLAAFSQLLDRLQRHGKAILKPVDGTFGYGLVRVEMLADGRFALHLGKEGTTETLAGAAALEHRLGKAVGSGRCLLQQCVDLPVFQGRVNDYRLIMQKDGHGAWHAAGIVGRFGAPGRILPNFIEHGYALPPDAALARAFGADQREAYRLKERLIRFATRVCTALDESGGCYGDLGLDLGIDRDRRLWLFEVNKRQDLELPFFMGEEQTYLAAKSGPLLYAAGLAGFGQ